jgi:two-component system chemotaxis response regulator CheB
MEPNTSGAYSAARRTPVLTPSEPQGTPGAPKARVLIVDDSAIVRKVLSDILSDQPDLEVVGTAPDPYVARDKIVALRPDVLTLDIEMPRMDGLTFLEKLMTHYPLPVIVISSLAQSSTRAAVEALSRGAVDVLAKPGGPYSVGDLRDDLPRRVRAAAWAGARLRRRRDQEAASIPAAECSRQPLKARQAAKTSHAARPCRTDQIIAIGASTGGTQAIESILTRLPAQMPPMVITQHIPAGFSAAFAERLNRNCALEIREAAGGETLAPGYAYIARGDHHLVVERKPGGGWCLRLDNGPKVCYQRPSVDVMFESVSAAAGKNSWGVLLTGMGSDGSQGMLSIRKAGGKTIAESENTCVVFGMPREAIRLGAAERVLDLGAIAPLLTGETRA